MKADADIPDSETRITLDAVAVSFPIYSGRICAF